MTAVAACALALVGAWGVWSSSAHARPAPEADPSTSNPSTSNPSSDSSTSNPPSDSPSTPPASPAPAPTSTEPPPSSLLASPSPSSADSPGKLAGRVTLPGTGDRPAVGAIVAVEDARGALTQLSTDAQGRFRIAALAAGSYAVTVAGPNGEHAAAQLEVAAGATSEATLHLEPTTGSETIEVRGKSAAEQREQSADAVTVVDVERAKRETADLGEVLARTQGVGVRRSGGLGSSARLSLAGLSDDQIRFFIDGVPLEFSGYPFGIANVPVNLIDRIEIYNGVLPIRFGADALGGGVNLVTDQRIGGTHGGVSYESGSFGTNRVTLNARHLDESTGLYARSDGFFDLARNDYKVDVRVPDDLGRLSDTRVSRFHDGYLAGGGSLELGVVDRPWARRLAIRGFGAGFAKEYQHDQTMSRVFGDVRYRERVTGGSVRYEQPLAAGITLDAIAGYAFTRGRFRDLSPCTFDWFGRCLMTGPPGEIDTVPHDQHSWEHGAFARVNLGWAIRPAHSLRLAISPTYASRSGDERLDISDSSADPLSGQRDLASVVSGVEHEMHLAGDRLENLVFVKHYFQRQAAEVPLVDGAFRALDRTTQRLGAGDSVRYRFLDNLYAKASYEYTTRLPRASELFGDNTFTLPNLTLQPEVSHNVNVSATAEQIATPVGAIGATVNGFLREASNLITVLGDTTPSYQNVSEARSLGIATAADWTAPGGWMIVDGNFTYQSFRNNSSTGLLAVFKGDRVPNVPYLFAGGSVRFKRERLFAPRDEVTLGFTSRYVHEFLRGWESAGIPSLNQRTKSQLLHTAGVTYLVVSDRLRISATLELSNFTDEKAFDFYGVQRPGRAIYAKTTLEL